MSLEEELVELNSVYQDCREEVSMLHEHIDALEKLLSDYEALASDEATDDLAWEVRRMELQQRTHALLNEGVYEPLHRK